jgi:glycosyltransferase involved in cell wall biosynthesis
MKRLLIFSFTYLPNLAGVANPTSRMAKAVRAGGWDITLVTTRGEGQASEEEMDGIRVRRFDIRGSVSVRCPLEGELEELDTFLDDAPSPDVYVLQSWYGWPLAYLLSRWQRFKVPKVLVGHGFGYHLVPWNRRPPFGLFQWAGYLPFLLRMPLVLRKIDALVVLGKKAGYKRAFDRWLCRLFSPSILSRIPNAVPAVKGSGEAFRARHGLEGRLLFALVANYSETKNQRLAAEAFLEAAIPGAVLAMIGNSSNEYMENLRRKFPDALGSGSLRILHGLSREEVEDAIMACDVALLSSRYEMQPLFLLEAASAGKPWICTRVGAVAELAGGVVVDATREALANALLTMREPDQRARLGAEGKHLWESEFEPGQIGKAWNDLLGKLCAPAR